MRIKTKFHGERDYEEKDLISFEKGIPGFEHLRNFILFSIEENDIFNILHSVEDESIGLVVVSPFHMFKDYEVNLEEPLIKNLKITDQQQVLLLNPVTLSSKVENITVNLKAPIIINIKERLGEQIILENEKYKIKHPLLQE